MSLYKQTRYNDMFNLGFFCQYIFLIPILYDCVQLDLLVITSTCS